MATTKKTATKAKKTSKQAKSRTASQPRRQKKTETKAKSPKEAEVTLDRRRKARRKDADETASEATPPVDRREKVQRRRQIDPTTCERDYSDAEVEFMNAMDEYKRTSGRMFPTCSEVLEVIRDLGYVQLGTAQRTALGLVAAEEPQADDEDEQESLEAAGM